MLTEYETVHATAVMSRRSNNKPLLSEVQKVWEAHLNDWQQDYFGKDEFTQLVKKITFDMRIVL